MDKSKIETRWANTKSHHFMSSIRDISELQDTEQPHPYSFAHFRKCGFSLLSALLTASCISR